MNATHHPERHSGLKIGGEQKGISHGIGPVTGCDLIAVTEWCEGEIIPSEQLDQCHVSGRIDPDDHRIVEDSVVQSTLHEISTGTGHVEIG